MARAACQALPAGTPIQAVVDLLGEGRTVHPHPGSTPPYPRTWAYSLGNWSFHGLDEAYLYVHFDPHDLVLLAEIDGY